VETQPDKKWIFFGCPLDCDERYEAIEEKLTIEKKEGRIEDPYEGIMEIIRREVDPTLWIEKGSLSVPGRLLPFPPVEAREEISTGEAVAFLDQDGCRDYADRVGAFIAKEIFPDLPCLLAIDHALTGGAYRQLSELYHPEEISLIVLDSHTDALPMDLLAGIIQYDLETNPQTLYDPEDPFIRNRFDSYNASSFLNHLLENGSIKPRNLVLLGIGDYPPKQAFRNKDPRVKRYRDHFLRLKDRGVTLLTKSDLVLNASKVKSVLKQIKTPLLYISIDLDIGAGNALQGVRFLDRQGLNEPQLFRVVGYLRDLLGRGMKLAGLDLTEINARQAGQDQTYRIAADIIKKLLWGAY